MGGDYWSGNPRDSHWASRMIKGMIHVSEHDDYFRINVFGGENPEIKKFLMSTSAHFAKKQNKPLVVETDDIDSVDRNVIDIIEGPNNKAGYQSYIVRATDKLDMTRLLKYLGKVEEEFRKDFDKYGEFKIQTLESAYSKYTPVKPESLY